MSLVIEQTLADTRLAFQVHSNAAIQSMRVASSKWQAMPPEDFDDVPIKLEFHKRSKRASARPEILRLEINFRAEGRKDAARGPEMRVFSVECVYEVDYLLHEGFQITPEHVKAFKNGNAIFNAWPYFREFLQSAIQRMGYPPLTAPFLRLQPKQPTETSPKLPSSVKPPETQRKPRR